MSQPDPVQAAKQHGPYYTPVAIMLAVAGGAYQLVSNRLATLETIIWIYIADAGFALLWGIVMLVTTWNNNAKLLEAEARHAKEKAAWEKDRANLVSEHEADLRAVLARQEQRENRSLTLGDAIIAVLAEIKTLVQALVPWQRIADKLAEQDRGSEHRTGGRRGGT